MKLYLPPTLLLTLLLSLAACAEEKTEQGFVSMFNGKDLAGWEGKEGGWWVEDGALTSESTLEKPCKKHHYLYWKTAEPADFIMRFQYRIVGGNSGIQFRSEPRPNFDTWGYQADIEDGDEWTGCLFQHDRGGVVMRGFKATIDKAGSREEEAFADPAVLLKTVRKRDWNDYEIAAKGSHITLRINGKLMCEVDDRDANYSREKGLIALQMHPGPPMKIQFKNLRINILE